MGRAGVLALAMLAGSGLAGCGTAPSASVELGTGCPGEFDELRDGDTLPLERGSQGAQHVWLAARSDGLDPVGMRTTFRLVDGASGETRLQSLVRFSYEPLDGGRAELTGYRMVIVDPTGIEGATLRVDVEATDRDGRSARASREVDVEWGDACD